MSKILVLCQDTKPPIKGTKVEYEFDPHGLDNLKDYKAESYEGVVLPCLDDDIDWKGVWTIMKPKGVLYLMRNLRLHFLLDTVAMNDYFIPLKEMKEWNTFLKVSTLRPEIVSPDTIVDIMRKGQDVNKMFSHKDKNPEVCEISIGEFRNSGDKLGGGAEGVVYRIPSWRSDVAVKYITDAASKTLFEKPIEGVYTGGDLTEVLSGSLITKLLSGTSKEGYLLHVQRYMGFYSCINARQKYDFYLITELVSGDFSKYFIAADNLRELKVMLWQTIFSLHSLNLLEFFHQDSSVMNIFYKNLKPDDEFLGQNIFSAKEFTYRLDGREWRLPNVGKIAKVADFGYTSHLIDPMVFVRQAGEEYRISNDNRGAYDISFFIITMLFYVERRGHRLNLYPLFEEWLQAIGQDPKIRSLNALEKIGVVTSQNRPTAIAEKFDPLVLLDGPFFSEVVMK